MGPDVCLACSLGPAKSCPAGDRPLLDVGGRSTWLPAAVTRFPSPGHGPGSPWAEGRTIAAIGEDTLTCQDRPVKVAEAGMLLEHAACVSLCPGCVVSSLQEERPL